MSDTNKRVWPRVRTAAVICLLLAPAALALFFIKTYAVNVVWWDEWVVVPLFDELLRGQLPIAELLAPHNQHIIVIPKLTTVLLGLITSWNTVAECYLSWFLLCLIGGVLFLVSRQILASRAAALASFVPVVWLVFSLRQTENLLWGFQMAFFFCVFFFLLTVYLMHTSQAVNWRFALSIVSGMACSLSLSNGVFVWPIGLVLLIISARQSSTKEARHRYLKMASIWCLVSITLLAAAAVLVWGSLTGSPSGDRAVPFVTDFITHLPRALGYALVVLGSPLSNDKYAAMGIGAFLLLLYACVCIRILACTKAQPVATLPLALILFALTSVALLAFGRSYYGVEQALTPRYVTVTTPGIVGCYLGLVSLDIRRAYLKPFLISCLIALIAGGAVIGACQGLTEGRSWASARRLDAYYLANYDIQSDETLARLSFFPATVREQAPVLAEHNLNVFSRPSLELEGLSPVTGSTLFSVDTINNQPLSQKNWHVIVDAGEEQTITILGWAIDVHAHHKASALFISIDGRRDVPAFYGLPSPDVARSLADSRYSSCGFSASFATTLLAEGNHSLSLKIVTADGKSYYETSERLTLAVQ